MRIIYCVLLSPQIPLPISLNVRHRSPKMKILIINLSLCHVLSRTQTIIIKTQSFYLIGYKILKSQKAHTVHHNWAKPTDFNWRSSSIFNMHSMIGLHNAFIMFFMLCYFMFIFLFNEHTRTHSAPLNQKTTIAYTKCNI